jgi:hypothetical protein
MRCVLAGGNWSNGSNAGVWARNLNNTRTNANNNVGFRADSMPKSPQAAHADWQRGGHRRALRRNGVTHRFLVAKANVSDGVLQ